MNWFFVVVNWFLVGRSGSELVFCGCELVFGFPWIFLVGTGCGFGPGLYGLDTNWCCGLRSLDS